MSDGTLSIRRRDPKAGELSQEDQNRVDAPAIIADLNLDGASSRQRHQLRPFRDPGEQRVDAQTSKKLKEYDKLLKSFKYSSALDSVLKKVHETSAASGFG